MGPALGRPTLAVVDVIRRKVHNLRRFMTEAIDALSVLCFRRSVIGAASPFIFSSQSDERHNVPDTRIKKLIGG